MGNEQNRPFYAQMHLHTSEASACGDGDGAQMAAACKKAGYSLIVVTDHFFNANTACPFHLPWDKKVDFLFKGYRAAKAVGDKLGLTVLKGWETMTDGPEYLTYGLDEEFLLDYPDIAEMDGPDYLRLVKRAGGFVCHAHPYRQASYIDRFAPQYKNIEAVEVFNAHHNPAYNTPAYADAARYNLIPMAGSDAHDQWSVKGGAMLLPEPVHDMPSLIAALRSRQCQVVETGLIALRD